MPSKRPGSDVAASLVQKRPKRDALMTKCELVVAALGRAGLDEVVFRTFSLAALAALPIAADARHPFYERVFAMVAEEFEKISDSLGKRVSESEAREAGLAERHAAAAGELEEKQAVQTRQEGEMDKLKLTLAECALSLRSAKGLAAEAELNLESEEARKNILAASALGELAPLLEQGPVPEDKAVELVQRLQDYVHVEGSLLALAPKALASANRHGIEEMAVQQLISMVSEKRAEVKSAIDADGAGRPGREEALAKAREALHTARVQLREAAASFESLREAVEVSKAAAAEAAWKLRGAAKELKSAQAEQNAAEVELELHRDQAVVTFEELRARKTPAADSQPVQEAGAERLVAAAPAPSGEELVQGAESGDSLAADSVPAAVAGA